MHSYTIKLQTMILKKVFLLLIVLNSTVIYGQSKSLGTEETGMASYYGRKFYGKKTAYGEILSESQYTCAHPTLPFNTMLEVTNTANGKWCVVRVNDRGPFIHRRLLDVSHIAAKKLGMLQKGVIKVKIMVVGANKQVLLTRPKS
jgi:rare lipoprotein A